ncbi:hypothetical protein HY498_02045 [Candidatus Woesearchaeota archaeon]|nr:hypothetical protein [Candidatus Woesearchaeota archaeon]
MSKGDLDLEKAQIMFKLARKNNWGHKYDRLEHFKRFQNLDNAIKDLVEVGWVLVYKKTDFIGISLNSQNKRDIIGFIEGKMPHIKGMVL